MVKEKKSFTTNDIYTFEKNPLGNSWDKWETINSILIKWLYLKYPSFFPGPKVKNWLACDIFVQKYKKHIIIKSFNIPVLTFSYYENHQIYYWNIIWRPSIILQLVLVIINYIIEEFYFILFLGLLMLNSLIIILL